MKLQNSLFSILDDATVEGGHDYTIELNPEHAIYKAHFPGQPITPGVCIIQIAYELLETALGKSLQINAVKNVKFLRVISPVETSQVKYSLHHITADDALVKVQVNVTVNDETYAKLSFTCQQA